MQETNFSKSIRFESCVVNINYFVNPTFKITSINLESFLEGKETSFNDNYQPDKTLDKIISSISSYFEEGMPIDIRLEDLMMESISGYYRKVLETLFLKVPHGKIITYHKLAELTGNPKASRAVGTAMASNPFPLLIPCHRVIKSDLSLGNYGSGGRLKLFLLENETGKNSLKNFSLINREVLV